MKKLIYIAPATEVITAYSKLLDDAVREGNISMYGHTQGGNGNLGYDADKDKSDGSGYEEGIGVVDAKNMWGNLWDD